MIFLVCATSLLISNPILPFPDLRGAFSFAKEPARPDALERPDTIRVYLTQEGHHQLLPESHRVNLRYSEECLLEFSDQPSLFWVNIDPSDTTLCLTVHVQTDTDRSDSFTVPYIPHPIQALTESSSFQLLAQARWLGITLFPSESHCIELGEEHLFVSTSDLLSFCEGRWQKGDKSTAIARIANSRNGLLEWDGWDGNTYIRFALPLHIDTTWKNRSSGMLSHVRIRSSKQISCILEKQSLVMKVGDWALKQNGSWKLLRKSAERDSFLHGELYGELFILDAIEENQGQQKIIGRCFHPSRTQLISIETTPQRGQRRASRGAKGSF